VPAPKIILREISSLEEMIALFPLVKQLTGSLTKKKYEVMLKDMLAHDYKMVGAFIERKCVGLSGFWISTKIYSGKYVEIDNLVIDKENRSSGIGKLLCNWIIKKAKKEGCETAMLDAYLENDKGHKFYFREGYRIRGFHFIKRISV
jgi:GNAT superfamily N-acetyltransferase